MVEVPLSPCLRHLAPIEPSRHSRSTLPAKPSLSLHTFSFPSIRAFVPSYAQLTNEFSSPISTPGFEGLTTDPSHKTLYALLQSATIQDGGDDDTTSRYTRLVAFDVSSVANASSATPTTAVASVTGEWVVPLPTSKKGKTRAASEVHYVSEGVFLVLSRDGNGHGDDDDDASYKCVRLQSRSSPSFLLVWHRHMRPLSFLPVSYYAS